MSTKQPRATFSVAVTCADYVAAARAVSMQGGLLRTVTFSALGGGILLVVLSLWLQNPLTRALLWILGALMLISLVLAVRGSVTASAKRDYETFCALYPTATVSLYEDELEFAGDGFCRRDPYALLTRMIETPALFVLVREDGDFVPLPKHDMPVDGGRVIDFLRNTFARKYRRTRG